MFPRDTNLQPARQRSAALRRFVIALAVPATLLVPSSSLLAFGDQRVPGLRRELYPEKAQVVTSFADYDLRPALAAKHYVLGLDPILVSSLDLNPQLRRTISDSRAAREAVWIKRLAFMPTVTASYSSGFGSGAISDFSSNQTTGSLRISATIFQGGRRINELRRERALSRAADLDVVAKKHELLGDLGAAYTEYFSARNKVQAIVRSLQLLAEIDQIVRQKLAGGFADRSDVAAVGAVIAEVKQAGEQLRESLLRTEAEIRRIAGEGPSAYAKRGGVNKVRFRSPEEAISAARRHNPTIRSARYRADAAEYDSKATVGQYLPQLDLYGSYERNFTSRRENVSAGVKLTVPLIDLTAVPSVRQSKFKAASTRYLSQDIEREVEQEIRNLWYEMDGASRRLAHERQRNAHLQTVVDATKAKFSSGFAGIDDVLYAQRDVLVSNISLAELQAIREAAALRINLKAGV